MGNESHHKKQSNNNLISLESIRKCYINISNIKILQKYFHEIFADLSDYNLERQKNLLSLVTFYDYMKIPIFISEKLFNSFDKDNDNFLNEKEFVFNLSKLYLGNFKETCEIIFNLLDFNKDGIINNDDVKILLSYLPLKIEDNNLIDIIQKTSLEEIDEIISNTFDKYNGKIKYKDFNSVMYNRSEIYLQLICYFYQNLPFKEKNINMVILNQKKKRNSIDEDEYENLSPKKSKNMQNEKDDESFIKIYTYKRKSTLSPADNFFKSKFFSNLMENKNKKNNKNKKENKFFNLLNIENSKELKLKRFLSDDKKVQINKKPKSIYIHKNNNYYSENEENTNYSSSLNSSNSENNLNYNNNIYKNYFYIYDKENNLTKIFLVLMNNEIYYYTNEDEKVFIKMRNLTGCNISEFNQEKDFIIENSKKLFFVSLIFKEKAKKYFSEKLEDLNSFILNIKNSIGYSQLTDYYQIIEEIGKGKFALVKLGINKKTNQKVAIKIIKKSSLVTNKDEELIRTEIDILKLCHHPNIIQLYDHFENNEYIFIVTEYIKGGTLNEYLKKFHFKFSENHIAHIAYQIGKGLNYLHQYGIVHRDLKPENIMITEFSNNGIIKIMDFGLSKIVGPKDCLNEGYGSLSYCAPEILLRTPYNKEVDVWSLGVIIYYMLTGKNPFRGKTQQQVAKKIAFGELDYNEDEWENRSYTVIDLIQKMLEKNPNKRIKIDDFLKDLWFKKFLLKFSI